MNSGRPKSFFNHFTAKTEFRIDQFQIEGGDRLSIAPVAALLLRLVPEHPLLDLSRISSNPDPS
jgi:hypothetical protein